MSTVKISELPEITHLNTNTDESLFVGVDLVTGTTGKMTITTLAEGLYAYQPLKVGENQVLFSNTIGQFSGNSVTFLQINNQNFNANGSADYVASASDSDNTNKYIDMGINGSDFSDSNFSSMKPYDGYLYSYGPSALSASGNLVVGTASAYANIVYIVGGTTTSNIVARMTKTDLQLSAGYNIKFGDGSVQSVAASPANYSSAAYAQANVTVGVDATQNTAIAATNGKMQSAYNTANSALANTTTITTAGDFNVSRRLTVNGTIIFANSNFSATEAAVVISASGLPAATPSNDGYMLQISGKNGVSSRIVTDSYGAGAYSVYAARTARGTLTSPLPVQSGDIIGRFSANGYGNTKFQQFGTGRIDFVASQNFTDANTGSQIKFWNCPNNSNTLTNIMSLNGDSAVFTGVVNPQKGFIYTPIEYPGAQTAITIDFANNSLLRCNTSAGVVVSFSDYVAGKVVELWITNTSGFSQTFTHGCSAINSTVNSTTYSIPSTSSILARYYSFDAALANTFVAIIK